MRCVLHPALASWHLHAAREIYFAAAAARAPALKVSCSARECMIWCGDGRAGERVSESLRCWRCWCVWGDVFLSVAEVVRLVVGFRECLMGSNGNESLIVGVVFVSSCTNFELSDWFVSMFVKRVMCYYLWGYYFDLGDMKFFLN